MSDDNISTFDSAAHKERFWARIFLSCGGIALVLFAMHFVWSDFHLPSAWSSKSGAVVTVFAILAVQRAQAMGDALRYDGGFVGDDFWAAVNKYQKSAKRLMKASTALAILGAFMGVFGN